MQAVRVQPAPEDHETYSPANPAPASALQLETIPIPQAREPGDLLIRVKASTVIRDALTWPETYAVERAIPGHDFAGVVVDVVPDSTGSENAAFRAGDEVYGMADADRGSTWAEYTVVKARETALKPPNLSWAEAAAVPLSALTAYEALFVHAGLSWKSPAATGAKRILITGSPGGVGLHLIQMCAATQHDRVVAASSSLRNEPFLRSLGATEVVEYSALLNQDRRFDVIIDTVGGKVLEDCWGWVEPRGALISVDSASFDFVNEHRRRGLSLGKEDVHGLFFIVKSNGPALRELAGLVEKGGLRPVVREVLGLQQAQQGYEMGGYGYGKVVLVCSSIDGP